MKNHSSYRTLRFIDAAFAFNKLENLFEFLDEAFDWELLLKNMRDLFESYQAAAIQCSLV